MVIPDHDKLDTINAFTLAAWIRPNDFQSPDGKMRFIFSKWYSGSLPGRPGDNGQYFFRPFPDGRLGLVIGNYDPGAAYKPKLQVIEGTQKLSLNVWSHVAVTFDHGLIKFGAEVAKDMKLS